MTPQIASLDAALSGVTLGLSLIIALGPQNLFVVRQALSGRHVLATALTCALCDAALIAIGVAGVGAAVAALPGLGVALRWAAVAFLAGYALLALRRGLTARPTEGIIGRDAGGRGRAVSTALGFSLLNPHVWLDTVVLIGGVSTAEPPEARASFAAGAMAASLVFFLALAGGARLLAPILAKPAAQRALDLVVAATMGWIAVGLALEALA